MKMMTNEERIKKGVKEQHERIRKVLSPRALKQMEEERLVVLCCALEWKQRDCIVC